MNNEINRYWEELQEHNVSQEAMNYFSSLEKALEGLTKEIASAKLEEIKYRYIYEELKKWLEEKQNLVCGCGITPQYIDAFEECLDKLKDLMEESNGIREIN